MARAAPSAAAEVRAADAAAAVAEIRKEAWHQPTKKRESGLHAKAANRLTVAAGAAARVAVDL